MRRPPFLAVLLTTLVPAVTVRGEDAPATALPSAAATGVNAFTADVVRAVAASGGNVFVSPYSIATAVAMARAGARGATAEEIDRALHLPADAPVAFRALVAALGQVPRVPDYADGPRREVAAFALSVANGLFVHRGWPFEAGFRATVLGDYAAELAEVDFEAPGEARKAINDWVALKTKDRIRDIVPAGMPTPDTRMALANAIHFQAQWADPFPERATADKPFAVAAGKDVVAKAMARTGRYAYAETEDAQVVELPYRGAATSMVVILPKARDGLDALAQGLTPERLAALTSGASRRMVAVQLPRFRFTTSTDAARLLAGLGVHAAFDAGAADFTAITPKKPLFVGAVLHKAFVAVDENGTEAAAATVVMMRAGAAPRPETPAPFVVDHPFLFVIRHAATGAILFVGRVVDPTAAA